jgi:alpha-beta hydrolase superfamily lysophospholipase
VLILYSERDQIIRPDAVERRFAELGSTHKRLVPISDAEDAAQHVLAGDILSPRTTESATEVILDFLREMPD